ncbi:hypothetical protein [Flavobacterium sp. GCM10027622]|uniref:hypothetical protein n=1 Tax=unclassified Flavobacterium TaxID=196869 RepID=UPI00360E14AD
MKTALKIIEIINIAALMFLLMGAYGLPVTGFLQVVAALIFVGTFPKNKFIYVYFGLVIFFFSVWSGSLEDWFFIIPIFLIFFLTFIIYHQKWKLKKENQESVTTEKN